MKNKIILFFSAITVAIITISSCQSEAELNYARYYTGGKKLYEANCQNCHNTDGSGLAALYPPLTDSVFLKQNKTQLACFIKNGMQGEIRVAGKTYDGQMPGQPQLSDIEIAQIITYITNSFGNQQGIRLATEVSADLQNCK